jgi:hypothetical protein
MVEQEDKAKRAAKIANSKAKTAPKRKKPLPKQAAVATPKPVARQPNETPLPKSIELKREPTMPTMEQETEVEEEHGNALTKGMGIIDNADFAKEAYLEGGTSGATYAELSEDMTQDAFKTFRGTATARQLGSAAASEAILGPLAIAGSIMEMKEGYDELGKDPAKGATTMTEGGLGAASATAGMLAPFVAGAATAAPLLSSAAMGMKFGAFGNDQVKDLGWLHNDQGESESASSWAADKGHDADVYVSTLTGNATLGRIAGAARTLEAVPEAAVTAAAAGVVAAPGKLVATGRSLGHNAGQNKRAGSYADQNDGIGVHMTDGSVRMAQRGSDDARVGGQQMASYDEEQEAAIARAKLLHPEQWGEQPNEVSLFNKYAEQARVGTRSK